MTPPSYASALAERRTSITETVELSRIDARLYKNETDSDSDDDEDDDAEAKFLASMRQQAGHGSLQLPDAHQRSRTSSVNSAHR